MPASKKAISRGMKRYHKRTKRRKSHAGVRKAAWKRWGKK